MRIISLLLALCFSLNVMAGLSPAQKLERYMDEYQYALSVEWDQKDQAFYDEETKAFFDNVKFLIENDGLSKEEILKLIEKKAVSRSAVEAVKLKISLLPKDASHEDLMEIVRQTTQDLYGKGASWNGETVIATAAIVFMVGLLVYTIWWDSAHECVKWENQYSCSSFSSIPHCGYKDVCTEYVKK